MDDQLTQLKRKSEERDAQRIAEELGLKYLDLRKAPVEIEAIKKIDESEAREAKIVATQVAGKKLLVITHDTRNKKADEIIKKLQKEGFIVEVKIGSLSGLAHVWQSYVYAPKEEHQLEGIFKIDKQKFGNLKSKLKNVDFVKKEVLAFDIKTAKTAEVLEVIFSGALVNRASDVHFEPEEEGVRLRYRIDGLLNDVLINLSKDLYHLMVSRLKVLSRIKLNITDRPQDGRFTIDIEDASLPFGAAQKEFEVRASFVPSEFGETIVLRLLYQETIEISMKNLGFRDDDLKIVQEELKKPNGMILNTGPTGSGKTTTLYAFLKAKQDPSLKIITIEKPIEYHLPGIEQTQVHEETGYDFAAALKSALRQDPDIILVGEINSQDTAEVALQAALTGHLVFSTVHANSATAAIPRLLDLGIKPVSIGPAINLIIAQRLVRKLCDECKKPVKLDEKQLLHIKKFLSRLPKRVSKIKTDEVSVYEPHGCDACGGSGYKGRIGIFELFLVDEMVEKATNETPTEAEFVKIAEKQGMTTAQEDGIIKVLSGVTTFKEVEVLTGPIRWDHE